MALGMIWLCVLTACLFAWFLLRENKLRDQGKRDYRYEEPEEERKNMGDDCKFVSEKATYREKISADDGYRSEFPIYAVN